jgi:hypothetical protein
MIINKKQFYIGLVMLILFSAAFAVMMSPVVNGKTVVETADDLFNSLTKGSTYNIPKLKESAKKYEGTSFEVSVSAKSQQEANELAKVFGTAGAKTEIASDNKVKISGDLGKAAGAAMVDADALFKNNESQIKEQYGINGPNVIKHWWTGFNALNSQYKKDGNADLMNLVNSVNTKGLEVAYNFDGIEAVKVAERSGITIFMLGFYIIYTVFYGFAIMYLLEGLGIVASAHGEKAEA